MSPRKVTEIAALDRLRGEPEARTVGRSEPGETEVISRDSELALERKAGTSTPESPGRLWARGAGQGRPELGRRPRTARGRRLRASEAKAKPPGPPRPGPGARGPPAA